MEVEMDKLQQFQDIHEQTATMAVHWQQGLELAESDIDALQAQIMEHERSVFDQQSQ